MNKTERYQSIWENIILPSVPQKYLDDKNVKYYYKIQIWLYNLLKQIKEDELEIYLRWFVDNKLPQLDSFNAGILCCDKMVASFKKNGGDYLLQNSRKCIKNKKEEFNSQRESEKEKFLNSILQKKARGERLSRFDKEALNILKEIKK